MFFGFQNRQYRTPGPDYVSLLRFRNEFARRKMSTVLHFRINFRSDPEKPVVIGHVCKCVAGNWISNVMPNFIDTIEPEAVLLLLVVVRDLQDIRAQLG
jgi:hypothetical protein